MTIIANDQGNRTTPCCVSFNEQERLIGDQAKKQLHQIHITLFMMLNVLLEEDFPIQVVQQDIKHWPFKVIQGRFDKPFIHVEF